MTEYNGRHIVVEKSKESVIKRFNAKSIEYIVRFKEPVECRL